MISKSSILLPLALIIVGQSMFAQSSGFHKLDEWTEKWKTGQQTYFGYPVNQQSEMRDFYEWYLAAGLEVVNLNNAGDPMTDEPWAMSSHVFEREVIDYFAPLYGFDKSDVWGIVTAPEAQAYYGEFLRGVLNAKGAYCGIARRVRTVPDGHRHLSLQPSVQKERSSWRTSTSPIKVMPVRWMRCWLCCPTRKAATRLRLSSAP